MAPGAGRTDAEFNAWGRDSVGDGHPQQAREDRKKKAGVSMEAWARVGLKKGIGPRLNAGQRACLLHKLWLKLRAEIWA